jgi:Ca-activated chloride channel family protein
MLSFIYPWFFLLVPLPWLVRRLLPEYREPRSAVRAPFVGLLAVLSGQEKGGESSLRPRVAMQWIMLALVWLALVSALARPVWMDEPIVKELPMRDLLVAVDLSGSMETEDFTDDTGAVTDRLTAAREVIDEFLSRRQGDRVGLVFFGTAAFVQAPFTEDLEVVRSLMDEAQVRMLGPKTSLGDAIGVAINLFERSSVEERVLIALTDGNDTGSMVPPVRAAEIARDNGVTIYTVAMGDPQAAGEQALDEKALEAVAATTGGQYFRANDRTELESIYSALDRLAPKQVEIQTYRPEYELYFWPAGFALLLSLLFFALSELFAWFGPKRSPAPRVEDATTAESGS